MKDEIRKRIEADSFGLNIARYRTGKKMSQAQLAEAAGVSDKTIQRIENGGDTSVANVMAFSSALGASPNRLFSYEDNLFSDMDPELVEAITILAETAKKTSRDRQKMLADILKVQAKML